MWNDHPEMVRALSKPGEDIVKTLTPERAELWHAGTLCATEACELLDAIKKYVVYNKPLDLDNVLEELGDLEFSLEMIRQNLRLSRDFILAGNMNKLGKRYGEGTYSDKAAQERADKVNNATLENPTH